MNNQGQICPSVLLQLRTLSLCSGGLHNQYSDVFTFSPAWTGPGGAGFEGVGDGVTEDGALWGEEQVLLCFAQSSSYGQMCFILSEREVVSAGGWGCVRGFV